MDGVKVSGVEIAPGFWWVVILLGLGANESCRYFVPFSLADAKQVLRE